MKTSLFGWAFILFAAAAAIAASVFLRDNGRSHAERAIRHHIYNLAFQKQYMPHLADLPAEERDDLISAGAVVVRKRYDGLTLHDLEVLARDRWGYDPALARQSLRNQDVKDYP